jgi:ABC-2 type transport system ATP-binding protein
VIEVQNVTKRYGPLTAVNDVSFRVESGQILGFLGPNGAGKTTTMRILTGCIPATDGRALIAGFDVFDEPVEAKRRTGYLPETPPLYPDMTVREYLTFASRISGVSASERAGRIDFAMGRTNVADVADRHCGKLSKGYRQRVGLAQAILHNPDVLILDEPTAGLDPKQIIETRELIKDLAGDHTIILSTHILPEVAQTCVQVVIINKGHVVAVDTPENLTGRLGGSETIRLEVDTLGADVTPTLEQLVGVSDVSVSPGTNGASVLDVQVTQGGDIRRQLANAIVSNGWGLLEMRRLKMSLEDIFLELTTQDEAAAPSEIDTHDAPDGDVGAPTPPEAADD